MISTLAAYVEQGLDRVTTSYVEMREAISPTPRITIREESFGRWRHDHGPAASGRQGRGVHVTLILDPASFLILTLPLPLGAKPYLDAVVASQIDRISPWPAEHAIFGTRIVHESANGLSVRVAIAARDDITRRLKSVDLAEARSVTLTVPAAADSTGGDISIAYEAKRQIRNATERKHIAAIAFGTIAFVILAEAARIGFGNALDLDLANTRKDITDLRETIAGASVGRDLKADPLARMITLKSTQVAHVEMLDALARILPDHTYLTAIETEPGKLHIEGISTAVTDLPKAISGQSIFGDANFSAPTAKRRDMQGETFQLDMAVKPRQGTEP